MIKDQCVSVTDLRTKTKRCLEGLEKEPKYVFINNKPVAVIVDITEYEKNFLKPSLIELVNEEVDSNLSKDAASARKTKKNELIDI